MTVRILPVLQLLGAALMLGFAVLTLLSSASWLDDALACIVGATFILVIVENTPPCPSRT